MVEPVGYLKTYTVRRSQPGAKSLEVTFPFEVVESEARKRELTLDDFLEKFRVQVEYGSSDAVIYRFIPAKEEQAA